VRARASQAASFVCGQSPGDEQTTVDRLNATGTTRQTVDSTTANRSFTARFTSSNVGKVPLRRHRPRQPRRTSALLRIWPLLSRLPSLRHLSCVDVNTEADALDLPTAEMAPKPSGVSEQELKRSVHELFASCERRVGRYLAQMVRDRPLAEDLLQDSFHDALRSRAQLVDVRNPEAWLFGIARNRALQALRKRRRFERALARLALRHPPQHEAEEMVAVRDLLDRTLSAEDRALVLLRYLHDFDSNELAEMSGLSSEAVRQRLARARTRLVAAAELEQQGETR
jgi:RNA polymerase sigma factor (sigma-70 family)